MEKRINYGTLIDPEKYYPITYYITQDGKKILKKGKLKGCDLTEKQIHELLTNAGAKLIIAHGGKRKGSGRKKGSIKEPTKVIRVPVSKVEQITNILKNKK